MSEHTGDIRAVIVNYRTQDLTEAAVRSLLADGEELEIVIVDNASEDGSAEALRTTFGSRVTVLEAGANLGFGRGVNYGAADTDRSLLFVLNSDARVRIGVLDRLANTLHEDERLAIAAPTVYTPSGHVQVDAFGQFPTLRRMVIRSNRRPAESLSPDWVSGVAFMVRRDAFAAVGGFDPRYWMYFEDIDLCRRLRACGWKIRRVAEAGVDHVGGASHRSDAKKVELYATSQERYLTDVGYPALVVRAVRLLRRGLDRRRVSGQ